MRSARTRRRAASRFSPTTLPGFNDWVRTEPGYVFTDHANDFNGSTQYLSRAYTSALNFAGGNFTIAAWVRVDAATLSDIFVSMFKYSTNERCYALGFNGATNRFEFWVSANGLTYTTLASSSSYAPATAWLFVVARYEVNDTGAEMKLSVNGGTVTTASLAGGAFTATTAPFAIAADGNATSHFDGKIDSVGVWDRPIEDAEITQLYNSGSGLEYSGLDAGLLSDLVSWWSLKETGTASRADSHGSNTLTHANSPAYIAGFVSPGAADEDPISIAIPSSLVVTISQPTIGLRPTLESTSLVTPRFVFDGTDDYLDFDTNIVLSGGFWIGWISSESAVPGTILGNSAGSTIHIKRLSTTQTAISDGTNTRTFTHAALTLGTAHVHVINGNGTALRHWVDGVESAASGTSFAAITLNRMGRDGTGTAYFNGEIGEIVYGDGQVLSDYQVNQLGTWLA